MSYYGLRAEDWRHKFPRGVKLYDFADGQYMIPMFNDQGQILTASVVALVQDPVSSFDKPFKILGFKIPYAAVIRKNADWGPIIDRMLERWNKGVAPIQHGERMPITEELFETPGPRPVEQTAPEPG